MNLAKYYLERLISGVNNFLNGQQLNKEVVFKKYVEFPELEIKFPTPNQICDLNDVEQAKILFRLANTQYRKALEYYNLENYLPEHVSIKQDISKLYRFLALMETDKSKIFAIHDRRRELLE